MTFRFAELPMELRNEVYGHLAATVTSCPILPEGAEIRFEDLKVQTDLLIVCKWMKAEIEVQTDFNRKAHPIVLKCDASKCDVFTKVASALIWARNVDSRNNQHSEKSSLLAPVTKMTILSTRRSLAATVRGLVEYAAPNARPLFPDDWDFAPLDTFIRSAVIKMRNGQHTVLHITAAVWPVKRLRDGSIPIPLQSCGQFLQTWAWKHDPYDKITVAPCFVLQGLSQRASLGRFLRRMIWYKVTESSKELQWGVKTEDGVQLLGTNKSLMRGIKSRI